MTETPELTRDAVVSLREITEETLGPVLKLSDTLSETQKHMVAPNAVSIAQAHFSPYAWFRAIYADETPVGFLMLYIGPEDDEKPAETQPTFHFIWRLMVGGPYQGRGYGRPRARSPDGAAPRNGRDGVGRELSSGRRGAGGLLSQARLCARRQDVR